MSNYHTTLLKISHRMFKKCFTELTDAEKDEVLTIYYDFY
jgi:hypothetical protein